MDDVKKPWDVDPDLKVKWQLWVRFDDVGWTVADFYETWWEADNARPVEMSRGAKEYKIVRVEVLA